VRGSPVRMCVGCHERSEKAALVRVVRAPDGAVTLDPLGSAPGRGAYVHREQGCVEAAFARDGLARALRAGEGLRAGGGSQEGGGLNGAARLRDMIERELRSQ
jgi:predicted RNA-binding protein YlxR (DUF448 family)